tara:strand:+ start:385 stop:1023 length:639 start_codon:yes stop_codon:yes gene_type:complete
MSRVIQLILFIFLIAIIFIFYDTYFKKDNNDEINKTTSINKTTKLEEKNTKEKNTKEKNTKEKDTKENNIIKNLKYEISIREDNDYQITSELSEITYKDGAELILMKKVTAILVDEKNNSLFVTSDNASYNNDNYNTSFENNVEIKYLDNIIFAENMVLDFNNNFISVYNNVRYNGSLGNLEADNIKINLITKKIDVFMNDTGENIVITTNK